MRNLTRLIPLILVAMALEGQTATSEENSLWTHYTYTGEAEGVVVEDTVVWVGTRGGLLKLSLSGEVLEKFTKKEGLPFYFMVGIELDDKGNKWIYGHRLCRYNTSNQEWTLYDSTNSPVRDPVHAIAFDSNEVLWAVSGDAGKIYRYDGNAWTTYSQGDGLPDPYPNPWSINKMRDICVDKNNVPWATSLDGVLRFDGEKWTLLEHPQGTFDKIDRDPDGNLHFTESSIVWHYDGTNWSNHHLPASPAHKKMVFDGDSVYVARYQRGVWKLGLDTWRGRQVSVDRMGSRVTDLAQDANGDLWCTSRSTGIWKATGSEWRSVGKEGLSYDHLHCLAIDDNNVKWFGTWNRGLCRFDGETWSYFDTSDGLGANKVWRMVTDRHNNLWASLGPSYEAGFNLSWYNGEKWSNYALGTDVACGPINEMAFDKDNVLWMVHESLSEGVTRFDGEHWTNFTTDDGLVNDTVYDVAVDSLNIKWFGTRQGLCSYDGETWTRYDTADGPLESEVVWMITVDHDNNKWFTYGDTIRYNIPYNKRFVKYNDTTFTHYRFAFESGTIVNTLGVDAGGNLWAVGTGASRFNEDEESWEIMAGNTGSFYDFSKGYGIDFDQNNNIWLCANNGAAMYSDPQLTSIAEPDNAVPRDMRKEKLTAIVLDKRKLELRYTLTKREHVILKIYSVSGKILDTLVDQVQSPDSYRVPWEQDKRSLNGGVSGGRYVATLTVGKQETAICPITIF